MSKIGAKQALWPLVIGATSLVALDIAIWSVIAVIGSFTSSSMGTAFAIWRWFHWPAFLVADVVFPPSSNFHDPAPLSSVFGVLAILLLQMALLGALLGWALGLTRRRRHAL